ncbi:MAG TPA: hypothetical protein PK677_13955 [Acidiphilium sp.]|nr:MAG: hypothetical protein B7X48_09230 [Acidiphilium sp. 34-60-192]HQT89632.1 hypothetical protein [Acidiphilium sp.]
MIDKFQNRLTKKSRKGFRGWPMATIAFYGPALSRASKVVVSIIHTEGCEPAEMRSWFSDDIDVRRDEAIGQEIVEFIAHHEVKSVAMPDSIMGCPHQQGIDYDTEWCPVCDFWKGRDRFTGKLLL